VVSLLYIYTHKIESSVQHRESCTKSQLYDIYKHQVTKLVQQDAEILLQYQCSNCENDTLVVGLCPFLNFRNCFLLTVYLCTLYDSKYIL
jgi:hypothetical protein